MEYISAASSLLHVAGVAIKTGHALYQLIYNVSEANKELEKLYYELKELTELVRQLRKLGEECLINLDPHSGILDVHNTLMQVLTQYVTDLEKLKGILGKEHPLQTLPLSNRITTWWNFSRKTKNINEMLERLERRKSAFVFVLVLLSNKHQQLNERSLGCLVERVEAVSDAQHSQRSYLQRLGSDLLRAQGQKQVSRNLSLYGKQPKDAPIFHYLETRNSLMVRQLIACGQVSPNDQDAEGNSLLWYALRYKAYDICLELLRANANPQQCKSNGDPLLASLIGQLPQSRHYPLEVDEDAMRLIRFLLHQQNEDVYGTRQYRRSGQVKYAPAPLVHCILSPRNAHLFIQGVLKLMVESSPLYCLEEPDTNENTALLEALYFSSEAELVEIATYLIKVGANVHAQNKYGEGCLHLLLRRLSACNNVNMDKSRRSAIVGLVENLLRLECDPKLKNNEGYTPFDAARSPAAWSIYCEAFLKAEKNIETYVFGLIGTTNLQHLASLGVQQAGKPSLAQDNSIFRPQNIMSATDKPCYLCGRVTGDQNDWAVPFDEFHSVVVEEMEVTIHMKLYHHPEGEICLHVRDEDSCGLLDYYPDRMSFQRRRDRAWRIQKALELWKDGYFVGHG